MSFQKQLQDFVTQFEPKFEIYLQKQILRASQINPQAELSLQEISRLTMAPAKRIRPALVYFGYLAAGGKEPEKTFELGFALELLHSFALIHDDIIDEAVTRRGQPTVEISYTDGFVQHPKSKHYGLTGAILAGDYAFMLCQEIFALQNYSQQLKKGFFEMQFELIAGQIDDCLGVGQADWDNLEEERILNMLKTKSGNYTIQKPLLLGAVLANADQLQIDILQEIGEKLGLVFQIVDDILGVFGDEQVTGKSTSGDILEGKRTLLMARTFQCCDELEKQQFKQIVGNPKSTADEITWVKDLVEKKGVLVQLHNYCQELVTDFQVKLAENFDIKNQGVIFLSKFAQYLLKREK